MACKQTLITYENIRVQRQRENICIPHVIRSPMVPSFCRLELPQPSYCSIKHHKFFMKCVFAQSFYNGFILKILARAIMSDFRKSVMYV